jgi:hypothetical protein
MSGRIHFPTRRTIFLQVEVTSCDALPPADEADSKLLGELEVMAVVALRSTLGTEAGLTSLLGLFLSGVGTLPSS